MLSRLAHSALALVLATQAIAEASRQPYRANNVPRMSVKSLFGVQRRQDGGYSPDQALCGTGATCLEACGAGFEQCASDDGVVHCYNRGAEQTCCPGQTGDSCDNGYFCTADPAGATWCCPDTMSLDECAASYNLPTLTSDVGPPPATSVPTELPPATDAPVDGGIPGYVTMTSTVTATVATITSTLPTNAVSSFIAGDRPSASAQATPSIVRVSAASDRRSAGGLMLCIAALAAFLI
jgi:hypothetical protein